MDGKQAILNKILEDASNTANDILSTAKAQSEQLLSDATAWANQYHAENLKALEKEKKEIVERKLTVAELDVRKLTLQAKQSLIDDVFDIAIDKLCSLGKTYYKKLVVALLEQNAEKDDEIILSCDGVLNEEDLSNEEIVKKFSLKFSSVKGVFKGGIKLLGKVSDKDLTFKSLIESIKEEKTSEVAKLLF